MPHVDAIFRRGLLALLVLHGSAVAGPHVPVPAEVQRYERDEPVFRSTAVANGAELLEALRGGQSLEKWPNGGAPMKDFVCVLPVPARWWVTAHRTDGSSYKIGFSAGGELVYLPEGLYATDAAARATLGKLLAALEDDLKREAAGQAKPCKYRVGTVPGGDTLSGIARIFYGDARKWKAIFEANRGVIKNPDAINSGMVLTIPAVP